MNNESPNIEIENLELKLLKSSQIEDGDILLVKMRQDDKNSLSKENIKHLYEQITKMINKKDINIYFFPDNMSIDIIKNYVKNMEELKNLNKNENNEKTNSN